MVQNVEHLHLHGGCVGKAILGFELQCSVDELIGLFAQVWAMFFERKIVVILYALEHFHIGIAPVGSCAREGFVQNDAETKEIGAWVERFICGLLRQHVGDFNALLVGGVGVWTLA